MAEYLLFNVHNLQHGEDWKAFTTDQKIKIADQKIKIASLKPISDAGACLLFHMEGMLHKLYFVAKCGSSFRKFCTAEAHVLGMCPMKGYWSFVTLRQHVQGPISTHLMFCNQQSSISVIT